MPLELNLVHQMLIKQTKRLDLLRGIFDYDSKKEHLLELDMELAEPDVWGNQSKAQALNHERSNINEQIQTFDALQAKIIEASEFLELIEGDQDAEMLEEAIHGANLVEKQLKKMEFQRMFLDDRDPNNAYLEIQSGAGGTDAQDWSEMLLRMYTRWAEQHQFAVEVNEIAYGEVAGIRRVTINVAGSYAYGWLRTESGVHRLVRRSPYKSDNSRQTSFAKVEVYPEVDDTINVDLDMSVVRVDTYRASGAGGQHINKTDSAVRLTHHPSGIVVQCQNQRSQHKNKSEAIKQLRSRLYNVELEKRNIERQKERGESPDIGWGSQIRSYILDQPRVKDHRTGVEYSNPIVVLNGDLDGFIEMSLKSGINQP